jgi:hypothetical protein
VTERDVARAIGVARIALGTSYVLGPRLALRVWPGVSPGGGDGDAALARLLARSTGGRDIALGLGALLALSHDAPVRGWIEAGMLADAADAAAIVLAFRHLPRAKALLMLVAAAGTAAAGRRLAASLG